ncbi:MAG: AI-2E family transporter [Candidatus Lambdaproteobacteria bacterium]|nr:AI-2E family transporter [Candidatus Lambdaproteobacteria bacterium]
MAILSPQSSYTGLWRALRDPRVITLVAAVLLIAGLLVWLGQALLPFIISVVVAYFLEGGVHQLRRRGWARRWAALSIYVLFLLIYLGGILGPLQLIARQTINLVRNWPAIFAQIQSAVNAQAGILLRAFPKNQQEEILHWVGTRIQEWGQQFVEGSLPAFGQATGWAVTMVLVPLLVFFLMLDKEEMVAQFRRLLPHDMELVDAVWDALEPKLANYVRGKMWEIIIVTIVTTVVFLLIRFKYAFLMGLATGLSVLIPYVGMIAVAVPITILGLIQWGATWDFGTLIIAYAVIQFLDGNVLVPYIFAEAVKMPPFYILLAVFVFGAMWGFWGVFLAIPLASLATTLVTGFLEFRGRLARETAESAPKYPG